MGRLSIKQWYKYTNYVTTIYVTGKELYAHTISLTVLGGSSLVTVEGSNVVIQSLGLSSRLGDNQQQPTAAEAGLARHGHSQRASFPLSSLSASWGAASSIQRTYNRHNVSISWSVCARWRHLNRGKTMEFSTMELSYNTWVKLLPTYLPMVTLLGHLPRASSREIRLETCTYPCHRQMSWSVFCKETCL